MVLLKTPFRLDAKTFGCIKIFGHPIKNKFDRHAE